MASKSLEKDASYLMTIKQKLGEQLCDYLALFNKAMLEIPLLEKRLVIEVAKQRVLANSTIYLSISKQKLTFFEQLKEKVEKYIRHDDAINSPNKTE